jgi:hypothetical protein
VDAAANRVLDRQDPAPDLFAFDGGEHVLEGVVRHRLGVGAELQRRRFAECAWLTLIRDLHGFRLRWPSNEKGHHPFIG